MTLKLLGMQPPDAEHSADLKALQSNFAAQVRIELRIPLESALTLAIFCKLQDLSWEQRSAQE